MAKKHSEKSFKNLRTKLRKMVNIAQKRRNRLLDVGIKSPALDLALSALGETGFYMPKKDASWAELKMTERIIERFLKSATSTVRGAKTVASKQRKGFDDYVRGTLGFTGNTDKLYYALGGLDIRDILKTLKITSDQFFTEMIIAEEDGVLNNFIDELVRDDTMETLSDTPL